MRTLVRRLLFAIRARQLEAELSEELEIHRAMQQERLERSGLSSEEAAYASRRALGNVTRAREEARDVWIWRSFERVWQDGRYGVRVLVKQRAFTATAVLTLTVGIGATSAIVSIVEAELWRPLPFPQPDRLVAIHTTAPGSTSWEPPSSLELQRWRTDTQAFADIAAYGASARRVLRGRGAPEFVRTREVSADFFPTLGWTTARGRSFGADDARTARAAILSDPAWRTLFGADLNIVGRAIVLDDRAYDIVGVLAPTDRLEFASDPDVYTVLGTPSAALRQSSGQAMRDLERRDLSGIGRLKPDVTIRHAQEELLAITRQLAAEQSPSTPPRGVRVQSLADAYTGFNWRPLYFFLGASLFVLVLSCANVANLLLARALYRQREFAIRTALGGGRASLVRQLLVEGLLLAGPGTAAGLLAAFWTVRVFSSWIPGDYLYRGGHIAIDARAGMFALIVCGATTLIFGLVPALFTRIDLVGALAHNSRSLAGSVMQRRAQQALVIAECTMAFILVFGAALFANSFLRLRSVPLGFEPQNRLVVGVPLSGDRYASPDNIVGFASRLIDQVLTVPGVSQAAIGTSLPLGSGPGISFVLAEQPKPATGTDNRGLIRSVSPAYFQALGMRLLAGRHFSALDVAGAPAVAVINETLESRFFAGADPIGREIVIMPRRSTPWLEVQRVQIVGVVQNSKDIDMHEVAFNSVYLPFAQRPSASMQLVVQTSIPPASTIDGLRRAVLAVDPDLPVLAATSMSQRVENALQPNRFSLLLLAGFAGVSVVLALIGLYGAMSYAVEQRRTEFALRRALGARAAGLLFLALRQSLRLGLAGTAFGLVAALILAPAVGSALYMVPGAHLGLIYGVTTTDQGMLMFAGAAIIVIASAAGTLPAWRAMRIDPVAVLRHE